MSFNIRTRQCGINNVQTGQNVMVVEKDCNMVVSKNAGNPARLLRELGWQTTCAGSL